MFSRKEREFLRAAVMQSSLSIDARLETEFPNPVYRRKLMWGIRQKASRSFSDWELYAEAARRDPRLIPRGVENRGAPPPVYADPMVTLVELVRGKLRRRRDGPPPSTDAQVTGPK